MNWSDRIHVDPAILGGKPVIRGTRLAIEFILGRMGDRATEVELLSDYPGLTKDDLLACLAYAHHQLSTSLMWIAAVDSQGRRLIAMNERVRRELEAGPDVETGKAVTTSQGVVVDLRPAEEHYFVIALGKAFRSLRIVKACDVALASAISRFESRLPSALDVRNMREHDDEYAIGRGRHQAGFVHKFEASVGRVQINAEATATIVVDGRYLLGGRLCVQDAVQEAELLVPEIQAAIDRVAECRGRWGA